MISRQIGLWLLALVLIPSVSQAQVSRIGQAPSKSHVELAGCVGCGNGHVAHHGQPGHYGGVVWGAQCYQCCKTNAPLFPPCPNPCRTTLLGELVMGTKHCLEKAMNHACNCLLSPCCLCGPCACGDCNWDAYEGTIVEGGVVEGEPIPVSPQVEPDPFTDDPPATGSGTRSTTRSVMPVPRGSAQARKRSGVRRVSHAESVRSVPTRRITATAKKPSKVRGTDAPRKLRYLNVASPIQSRTSKPNLRFRDQR